MAELDPEVIGKSGVDPETGSPLSSTVRNSLIRSSINFDAFRKQKQEEDKQTISLIQTQQTAFTTFNSGIQSLRTDIGKLGTGLASIALLLQQDGAQEQNKIRADQERERILTERQIRIGKESAIEQKIQNALSVPVEKLTPKVTEVFGSIGQALGILFTGWLTKQVVDAITASEENNVKRFNEIKLNILKNVGLIIGGLFAIKTGFSLIKSTIGSIASGLTRLLIAKPLVAAASLLPGRGKPQTPRTPAPRSGGGVLGKVGKFVSFLSGLMNFANKEYIDTTLVILSTAAKAPGPIGAIGKIAGVAFTADEIAEAFGKNIFDDPMQNKIVDEIAKIFKKDSNKTTTSSTPVPTTKPASTKEPSTPPPVIAEPKTPMMGEPVPSAPPPVTTKAEPSSDMVSKFQMAWQYRNNPFARGRIESEWEKLTPEQQQMAIEWAKSKGYDWNEMKLKAPSANVSPISETKDVGSTQQSATISSAQVSAPVMEPTRVGELPEAKPSLTMIKTSSNQMQQQQEVPLSNEPLTDVPLINSANPNNFYVLYSQINYNIVT